MKILLDIDGVMVITPTWKQPEFLPDNFMAFDKHCGENLAKLVEFIQSKNQRVEIVMTSTHRIHYSEEQWQILLNNRGIFPNSVSIINTITSFAQIGKRLDEILEWAKLHPNEAFIILDDNKSLRELPLTLQSYWVECQFLIGFNAENLQKALNLADTKNCD